jgi:hypothetical protein
VIPDRGRRAPGAVRLRLAKGFYCEGFQTSISFRNGTGDELRQDVTLHDPGDPDSVVLTSGRYLRYALERPRHAVWLFEDSGDPPIVGPEYPSRLYTDVVDLIGSRAAEPGTTTTRATSQRTCESRGLDRATRWCCPERFSSRSKRSVCRQTIPTEGKGPPR